MELLLSVARCPVAEHCLADGKHPCAKIVGSQGVGSIAEFQSPEPWSGHIATAPILFVSSNPSIGPTAFHEYPRASWTDESITEYFEFRFGGKPLSSVEDGIYNRLPGAPRTGRTAFWVQVRARAAELLETTPANVKPGKDYALTEVVRCKSVKQYGVAEALSTCTQMYLKPTLDASAATVVVVLGKCARQIFCDSFGLERIAEKLAPGRHCGDEAVLGRPPRAAATGHRRRPGPSRGRPPLRRRPDDDQALAATAGGRRAGAHAPARPRAPDRPRAAGGAGGAAAGGPGRHAGRALRGVGAGAGRGRARGHDVARDPAPGLDGQKKVAAAAERDEAARAAWREAAAALDPTDLVFVDESGTNTAMTPRSGRAPRGQRAVGTAPRNHGPNVTLLAALTPDGIGPALVIEGATDGPAFARYAEQLLVPSLRPGPVVVPDNLSVHRAAAIQARVEGAGCRLLFLPAYSPDFNPIEPAFAKVKQALRRAGARPFDALVAAIGEALDAVTATDAHGFFTHCGFPLQEAN